MADFPPPPRKVVDSSALLWTSILVALFAAFLLGSIASNYQEGSRDIKSVLTNAKEIEVPVRWRDVDRHKGKRFYLYYRIPGDPGDERYTREVDLETYQSHPIGSKISVIINPADPANFVLENGLPGEPDPSGAEAEAVFVSVVAFIVLISIRIAAAGQRRVLETWLFGRATVVNIERIYVYRGGTIFRTTFHLPIPEPSLRVLDLRYVNQFQIGQDVGVLYDPSPMLSGLKLSAQMAFVKLAPPTESAAEPNDIPPIQDGLTNWAGNVRYSSKLAQNPSSVEELQNLVAHGHRMKALGTRHSFSTVADTTGDLISTSRLARVLEIDGEEKTVTIEPGVTYGTLGPMLDAAGLALPNMASLPHISVVGACSTATHGSGVANQMLSCSVKSLDIVNAQGECVTVRGSDPTFQGAVVSLGALGVVSQATLALVPHFEIAQTVYEWLPLDDLRHHFREVMSGGYSVSLFYDWQTEAVNQVWVKRMASDFGSTMALFGARSATGPRHPLPGLSASNCTEQQGVVGPWYDRLPHFRLDFTPSNGLELQSEYFVPLDRGFEAMEAVRALREQIKPLLQISEIRTVAADDLWLSPAYRRPSLAIHFTWHQDWPGVKTVLPKIESALGQYGVRPHWGKLFTMEPTQLRAQYEQLPRFVELAETFDPKGKFRNEFLDRNVFSG